MSEMAISEAAVPARDAAQDRRSWTITLPCAAWMVPVARTFTRAFLGAHPRAGDAELIASEYAGNAARYAGPDHGGAVHVTIAATAAAVRIEVTGPSPALARRQPRKRRTTPAGTTRTAAGFLIVDALAARWGHYGPGGGPLTAWAELGEPTHDGSGGPRPRGGGSRGEMR